MHRLQVLLFLAFFFASTLSQGPPINESCKYENLPQNLNSLSYLGLSNEFHIHGEYRLDFSQNFQYINFQLIQDTSIRVYLAPHESDIDLWLFNQTSGSYITYSSLDIRTEEVIAYTLPPGSYLLKLNYFGYWIGNYHATDCEVVHMEIQMVPKSTAVQRLNAINCPQQENFPSFTVDSDALESGGSIYYHSDINQTGVLMNAQSTPSPIKNSVRWLQSYPINLPYTKDHSGTWWVLEATLGFDFLSGDSLGLVIVSSNDSSTPNLRCFTYGNCSLGVNLEQNINTLKTTLTPGSFYLWIYEKTGEKDSLLPTCAPFTFEFKLHLVQSVETSVTCEALSVPTSLIPGMYDWPPGYAYYRDQPLLELETGGHTMSFYVTENSFFRAYTAPHRVDIDLKLTNKNTGMDIEYAYSWGGDEAIATYLAPGNYSLSIVFFGSYSSQFCETFDLEVAVEPASLLDFSYCNQASSQPDLSDLQSALLSSNANYSSPLQLYSFDYQGNYRERQIFSQNFTVIQTSNIKIELGDNFLVSDLSLYLYDFNAGSTAYYEAIHFRNNDVITATLNPGNFAIVLSTGPVQRQILNNFPPCAQYTFKMEIKSTAQQWNCWQNLRLPRNLNFGPSYLKNGQVVHIAREFLVPLVGTQWTTSESVLFSVNVDSFFRIWTEPHEIDIDFYLYESGKVGAVASTIRLNTEESIMYRLVPGKNYTLTVIYYRWGNVPSGKCYTYDLELAIAPVVTTTFPSCNNNLPGAGFIANYSEGSPNFDIEQTFTFDQRQLNRSLSVKLPFTVQDDFIYFRAFIRYDFLWADLSLRLWVYNVSSALYSQNFYNENDLSTRYLGPGSYILEIYEPKDMQTPSLERCTTFTLTVAYEAEGQLGDQDSVLGCDAYLPPTSFDTLPYLSALTGNMTHIERQWLVDTKALTDYITFTLYTPSILTIYIPSHPNIDIDIMLYSGSIGSGTLLENKNGFTDESIYNSLNAGKYYLQFRYYGVAGAHLPPASDCPSFPASLSIVPVSYLTSISALSQPCTVSSPVALQYGTVVSEETYSRQLSQSAFSTQINFLVTDDAAAFTLDLRSFFPARGLTFTLTGLIDDSLLRAVPRRIVTRSFASQIGMNRAYLYKNLMKGNYTLTIKDPFPINSLNSGLVCQPYSLSYLINITSVDGDTCDNTDPFPTDLFSADGGSSDYGGPQAADGSIRLWSEKFSIDITNGRDNLILFNVPVSSVARMFINAEGTDDVDLYVYSNVSRGPGTLKYLGIGTGSTESALLRLNPQSNPYLLDVFVYRVDPEQTCPTVHFEFAQKPLNVVQTELRCPVVLPSPEVPPASIDFTEDIFSEDFIFTSDRINGNTHNGIFRYRMTMNAQYNTTIFASIGYDFLANDFSLKVRDTNGNVIADGEPSGLLEREDYFNFYYLIFAELTPGTYFLDISEDVSDKSWGLNEYCHRFSFFLLPFVDYAGAPEISYVSPPAGQNLDPFQPLSVSLVFSEAVNYNSLDATAWVQTANAFYLYPENSPSTHMFPTTATYITDHTVLVATWAPANYFQLGAKYILFIDASKFKNEYDTPFNISSYVHSYQMDPCLCSGHGACDTSQHTLNCRCNTGYVGTDCSSCDNGYHGAGSTCVLNTYCTNNFCNGNGNCTDDQGFPVCNCDQGYATVGDNYCASCAPGYIGYPTCTSIGDELEKQDRCTAPILPKTLNEITYLGYSGAVHLQGNYFIDVDNLFHETQFSLTQDSVFRLYVEPSWVDIDIWLYRLRNDGSRETIANGISIYDEEVIYKKITGNSDSATQYIIKFRYFVWDHTRTPNCETFNMELSIAPTSQVITQSSIITSHCSTSNQFPVPPNSDSDFYLVPTSGLTFNPNTQYTLLASNLSANTQNFFWSWNFVVQPADNQVAILHAEVDYRFLTGQIAILLEQGTAQGHCGTQAAAGRNCDAGVPLYDMNYLHLQLPAGNYTLWLYEPVPQDMSLTSCALFEFSMSFTFQTLTDDLFNCDAYTVPTTLNAPGYLDDSGSVHIRERFLVSRETTAFEVQQTSFIRVHGYATAHVGFTLKSDSSGAVLASAAHAVDSGLFYALPPGGYILEMYSLANSATSCPLVYVELAIEPSTQFVNLNCNNVGSNTLPSISQVTVGTKFGPDSNNPYPTPFYTYLNNDVIKQWTFTISETALLEAAVTSDFLTAAMRMVLVAPRTTTYGIYHYNKNILRQTLQAGTYTLKITRASSWLSATPTFFPSCAEFNFELAVTAIDEAEEESCEHQGEELATTFDSIRFLGFRNFFNFQSDVTRIEDFTGFDYKDIQIPVDVDSVLRVYTEPHSIDIDITLLQNGITVAHGGYTFNQEEEIVYHLQAGSSYTLEFLFFSWNGNTPTCPQFNFQVSISPVVELPARCLNNGDHIPPQFPDNLPVVSYYYNNLVQQENLYYQEATEPRTLTPIQFTLTANADVYIRLGANFATSDLSMKLSSSTATYYGTKRFNGAVLDLTDLPNADYTLSIYEVAAYTVSPGCAFFTFEVDIQPHQDVERQYIPPLPRSLNGIEYLAFFGHAHLQGNFELFRGSSEEVVSFTLASQSLVRVATDHYIDEINAIQIAIYDSTNTQYSVHMENILQNLPPGTWSFHFKRPNSTSIGLLVTEVEIAMSPAQDILNAIGTFNQPATCSDVLPPNSLTFDGTYNQFYSNALYLSQNSISTKYNFASISLPITTPAVLYAQLGFNFLLSDMEIGITGTKADGTPVQVYGKGQRNINSIDQFLPIGQYTITITQPLLFPYTTQYPHCTNYALTMVIKSADQQDIHTDCTLANNLPFELNTPAGGSSPFGGPIDSNGHLHFFGTKFLMAQDSSLTDTIRLNISRTTLLTIVTQENYYGNIDYIVSTGTGMKLMSPSYISSSNDKQKAQSFSIGESGAAATYDIELKYHLPARTACPFFDLLMVTQPRAQAVSYVTGTSSGLPNKQPVINNGIYSESLTSCFDRSTILTYSSSGTFSYEIRVNLTVTSRISVSLEFNPTVAMFGVTISKMIANSKVQVGRGYWSLGTTGAGQEESLATTYTSSLSAGLYFITITHPNATYPFTLPSRFCLPFVYSVSVGPSNGQPYVSSVSPPGSRFVNPSAPLTIAFTFSEALFNSNKQLSNTYYSPLVNFFYLQLQNGTKYVYPSNSSADDPVYYITFTSNFVSGQRYLLKTTPGVLTDSDGNSPQLLTDYIFAMSDTNCSNHGTFDSGICFCCNGYDGDQCERCADGYAPTNLPGQPLICSQLIGNQCTVATCGCNPTVAYGACYGQCQPLGTCDDATGTCQCNTGYAGDHCEICAEGYTDYEHGCKRISNCEQTCIRGTCENGVCKCPDHFTGSTCDECAQGWSGSDCSQPVNTQSTGDDPYHKFEGAIRGMNIFGIIVAVCAVLGTIALLIYKRMKPHGYSKLDTSELNDITRDDFLEKDDFPETEDEESGSRRKDKDEDEPAPTKEESKEVKKEEKLLDL